MQLSTQSKLSVYPYKSGWVGQTGTHDLVEGSAKDSWGVWEHSKTQYRLVVWGSAKAPSSWQYY